MPPPIVFLYDVPSHQPQPWAPNVWKIRFVLNYKRVPYRTIWVELPDVERTMRSIGAAASSWGSDGRPIYNLPMIVDNRHLPRPAIVSNADAIIKHLEDTDPARPVIPEGSGALQALFVHYIQEVFSIPLLTIMIPLSHQRLPERTRNHFRPQDGFGPSPMATASSIEHERTWYAVKQQFDFLATILDKNPDGDGVLVMGDDVTYADFVLCSILLWVERMAPYDGWARIRTWHGGRWSRLKERCGEYMDVF